MEDEKLDSGSLTEKRNGKFKPLRVWPAIVLVLLIAALKIASFFVQMDAMAVMITLILGPLVLGLLVLIWWVTFSRASASEKALGFFGVVAAGVAVHFLIDPTMRGPGQILIGIPIGMLAFGIVAILMKNVLSMKRTIVMLLATLIGFSSIALFRNDGMWGSGQLGLDWRWNETPEEKMMAQRSATSGEAETFTDEQFEEWLSEPEWPGFRGPNGDGRYPGPDIATDWKANPLKLDWKIPVGPGWSSFAVAGNLLFTQEQHGEQETVVCYAADSGKEIWKQHINERFFDPLGGPGPRATPTIANGMLFAQSAMGDLQRLDPKTGELIWTKDLKELADREPPQWGFSSSPLVVGDIVVAYAGGADGKGTLGFDAETGELVWSAKSGNHSYATPQIVKFGDRESVAMLTNDGVHLINPATGDMLLDYEWPFGGYRATQPHVLDDGSMLLPTQELGTRRIELASVREGSESAPLTATEVWTAKRLKPDFNDFVIYEDHAYGFDGGVFLCVDMSNGKRKWKGGRYGKGQVLLLQNAGLLLVAAEDGKLALLKADPSSWQELSKFQALEGRTWNHPVVIGDRLYVRNSQEAACFILPTTE